MKKFTNVSNYQKKLAAIAVCGALAISGVSFSMSQADASTSAALIGMGKGADIALSDAGLKENQVNDLTAKYRTENGVSFYTVTFTSGSYTYEYRVNAVDGSILQADRNAVTQATENGTTTGNQTTTTKKITKAKAKSIALKHAGVSASKATFVTAKLDYEDGQQVYEIEFYSGNIEYDYEILASSGEILSFDKDIEGYSIPKETTSSKRITKAKAKSIALKHAGVSASKATFVKAKLDYEDGRRVYEIEFYSGNTEYDYEILASSGEILSFDKDIEGYSIPKETTSSKRITKAKAKSIALKHAGVSASKATFVKAKLDYEDGRRVYEIEFYSGNTEYDYEILASNGKIISYDKDIENYKIPRKNTSSSTYIGKAKAKSIALKDAGVSASSATFTKTKLDYEDGIRVYEIEFYTNSAEYEYEINAKTGKIRDMDVEHFDYDDDWD